MVCMKPVLVARKGKGALEEYSKDQKCKSKIPCYK